MSNSIADVLSEAQLAALQQIFSNNGEAVVSSPKATENRPVVKASGFELIRCLNGYAVPDDEVVFVGDDAQYWGDDSPITFGDLRFVVEDGAEKRDGTKCRDYPNVWALSQAQCSAAITFAKTFAKTFAAKQRNNGGKKFSPKAKSDSQPKAENDRIARLEALVMQLAEGQFKQSAEPAKPVRAAKAANVPAKPEIHIAEGDVVTINGESWQVTVHANGKPAFRKTVV